MLMAFPLGHLHHLTIIYLNIFVMLAFARENRQFIYNGFQGANHYLHLDGLANIHPSGLLQLTNRSIYKTGHAFYLHPMIFRPNLSFSTTFAFAMQPQISNHSGYGITFVISPTMNFHQALSSEYLGLFNTSTNGLASNHVFAVELESVLKAWAEGMDDNLVGIDVNSVKSVAAASASYFEDEEGVNKSLLLISGKPMQVWIDYDGREMLVNVTLAPISHPKPSKCLLSKHINLSSLLLDSMYIGFSASTEILSSSHYILGWSWNQSGKAQDLDPSKLPSLPRIKKTLSFNLTFLVQLIIALLLFLVIVAAVWSIRRKKYQEMYDSWEQEYVPHRIPYKDLFIAAKGFRNSELLGVGGFGKVYKGTLPSNQAQVAVKRVSYDSNQGMREFVAEIASMRKLRHRNLVQLLGYCRRKGELLLVYDYMPNGSLDKILFDNHKKLTTLCWSQRFKIIKGVASALLYLHEGWEQVVLHRDVKASNVLLDAEMNARLGDFGLARLYDHGTDPRTTRVVGTMGYMAPEVSRTRKLTTSTDVFAFGMFLLEVAYGRRPIDPQEEEVLLIDWVYECWKKGNILKASDSVLTENYDIREMEMVLKLGLLCSHPKAEERPSMRQVVQVLDGSATSPEIPSNYDPEGNSFFEEDWGMSVSVPSSFPTQSGNESLGSPSSTNTVLQSGC